MLRTVVCISQQWEAMKEDGGRLQFDYIFSSKCLWGCSRRSNWQWSERSEKRDHVNLGFSRGDEKLTISSMVYVREKAQDLMMNRT